MPPEFKLIFKNVIQVMSHDFFTHLQPFREFSKQFFEKRSILSNTSSRRSRLLYLLTRQNISIKVAENLDAEEKRFLMAMTKASLEWERQTLNKGRTQGIEQGIKHGKVEIILMQLSARFTTLPDSIATQIEQLSIPTLDELAIALLNFSTIAEVEHWLVDRT
jgi:hypothetical protein